MYVTAIKRLAFLLALSSVESKPKFFLWHSSSDNIGVSQHGSRKNLLVDIDGPVRLVKNTNSNSKKMKNSENGNLNENEKKNQNGFDLNKLSDAKEFRDVKDSQISKTKRVNTSTKDKATDSNELVPMGNDYADADNLSQDESNQEWEGTEKMGNELDERIPVGNDYAAESMELKELGHDSNGLQPPNDDSLSKKYEHEHGSDYMDDEHEIDSSSDDIRLRNIPPSTTTTPFLEVSSSMIPTCGWLERLWNRCK